LDNWIGYCQLLKLSIKVKYQIQVVESGILYCATQTLYPKTMSYSVLVLNFSVVTLFIEAS